MRRSTSKFDGLRLIDIWDLPHPEWILICPGDGLPERPWAKAPHGWSVRCAPRGAYEFMLPAAHHLQFQEMLRHAAALIDDRRSCIVVYPSWQPRVSGIALLVDQELLLEAVQGPLEPLARGVVTPDLYLSFEGPLFNRLRECRGNSGLLSPIELSRLTTPLKRVSVDAALSLEWVVTDCDEVMYFDWHEL